MNEIEVVIKIPKWVYDVIVERDDAWAISVADKVKTGVVLPKGHGRLIDADALPLHDIDDANHGSNYIRIAPTILDADKE